MAGQGGILYCVVARQGTVLARHATCVGNFGEISELVLAKVREQEQAKMTFTQGEFLFHYTARQGVVTLVITDADFERATAFQFLDSVMEKFLRQYGDRAKTAIAYSMNSEFSLVMASEVKRYSRGGGVGGGSRLADPDKISTLQSEVDQVKDIMVANIDVIIERGEKLDLLVDKTEHLSANSVTFRNTSRNLQRAMWWKNMKLTIGVSLGIIVFLYIVVCLSCGGPAWPKCV